jgi:predicted phosphodiesterase
MIHRLPTTLFFLVALLHLAPQAPAAELLLAKKERSKPAPAQTPDKPAAAGRVGFRTGPVLGCAGTDYLTVSCRTTAAAAVTLQIGERQWTSEPGTVHLIKADGLKPATAYSYSLTAKATGGEGRTIGPFQTKTLPAAAPFTFAALGDSRSNPKVWSRVAQGVMKGQAAFVVHSGDLVTSGDKEHLWDTELFGAAPAFFAAVPSFCVLGNHERDTPLFGRLIAVPGDRRHWSQAVGPVLLIGIDGGKGQRWGQGSENLKWLEQVLQASREKFIFLVTHYPAWTSALHGNSRDAQQAILPLMKKYQATAMIAGHDHVYERSEPPDGVTVIITGGAGAPLSRKVANAAQQNPHSRVFAAKHHFCLLTVEDNVCRLKALTPDGQQIDETQWKARGGKDKG